LPDSKKSPWSISSRKLSNLKVVALCILAATTFWVLNALNKDNYNTIVDYPVQWEYDTINFVAVQTLPKSIQIQISGNGWDLLRKYFSLGGAPFPIALKNPAEQKFLLTADLKRGLSEFITPTLLETVLGDTLRFQIDRIVTKTLVPVLDSTGYALDKNIVLDGPVRFSPNKLQITGPSSILEAYGGKFPVQLNESKINKNFSAKIPLELDKKLAALLKVNQKEIEVSFDVLTYLEGNKRLKIKRLNFPKNVGLANEELVPQLTYLIAEAKVIELKDLEFEAVLDYRKRNRADSSLLITVNPLPEFLKEVRVTPAQVKLKYD
jgi:hypothetical protein